MALPSGLSVAEVKITGDEFVVLQNNSTTPITDLGSYWLQVFNSFNPLSAGVSSSSQQLPVVSLDAGQTMLLSTAPMPTCGAAVAGKLSLSLSDGGGFLQLSRLTLAGDSVTESPSDALSWSGGDNGLIPNVPAASKDPRAVYYRYFSGSGYAWQLADQDSSHACQLNVVVAGGSIPQSDAITPLAMAASSPPATILSLANGSSGSGDDPATLPEADVGLLAPQLSELLPNPQGTGNDATDEFIELYNPNSKPFDLSGFILQTGLSSPHSYTFPGDTTVAASSFKAFYSSDTGLSLSNTSGQAKLLDPFGAIIGSTDPYGTAKDGYAWAVAKGKWYWTTTVTPGAANIIKAPTVAKKVAPGSKKSTSKNTTAVKGANTANDFSAASDDIASVPVHIWVLALVATAALLYGAYEYRHDLGNRIYQLRSHWRARHASR